MADQRLSIVNFQGGLSSDDKFGPPNSFGYGESVDFRRSPGILTTRQLMSKESGSTVTQQVNDGVRTVGGNVYLVAGGDSDSGVLYKRAPGSFGSAGTYSAAVTGLRTTGGAGACRDLDYRRDLDALLIYGADDIHWYAPISGAPSIDYNRFTDYTVNNQDNTGGTYTLPTSLTEADKLEFVNAADPANGLVFDVNTQGTGNWTATLHDAANNVVATATIANASVPASGAITFDISGTRLKLGVTYHVHLHVSTGTSRITTSSANTIPTADFSVKAGRLVNAGEYGHRTMQYGAKTLFCNERYIGEWDILDTSDNATSGYDPHRIELPPEVKTNGIATYSEYAAISGAIDDSTDTGTNQAAKGVIFFWNGVDDFINFLLEVPQGIPNSLYSANNSLYWEACGRWYRWSGGDIEMLFEFPVRELEGSTPKPATRSNLRAARQAIAFNDNLVIIGYPYNRTYADLDPYMGMFSYGQSKNTMPPAINYENIISTGNKFTTETGGVSSGITFVKKFGNNVIVAWRDYSSGSLIYGVDYYNETSISVSSAEWWSLWFDNGQPDREKSAKAIKITFDALPTGCTIRPQVEYDRSGSAVLGETTATAGDTEVIMYLPDKRFYEARFGMLFTSSAERFPRVRSITFKFDDNSEEENNTEVYKG